MDDMTNPMGNMFANLTITVGARASIARDGVEWFDFQDGDTVTPDQMKQLMSMFSFGREDTPEMLVMDCKDFKVYLNDLLVYEIDGVLRTHVSTYMDIIIGAIVRNTGISRDELLAEMRRMYGN